MLKKLLLLVIAVVGILITTSCGVDKIEVNNPLTEDEVIAHFQNQIFDETGDTVIVNITSKEDLEIPTLWLDTYFGYKKVENGYSYTVEIINKDNTDIVAMGSYSDGYIIYDEQYTDGKMISEGSSFNNYEEQRRICLVRSEMRHALDQKFDNYYIHKDISFDNGYDIFIHSSDYDDINELLSNFKDIVIIHKNDTFTSYNIYIYKDEDVFNDIDFNLYKNGRENPNSISHGKDMIEQFAEKEATQIGFSNEFSYDLFTSNGASGAENNEEYTDFDSFDYFVFWYKASPNSFEGADHPDIKIFGVK